MSWDWEQRSGGECQVCDAGAIFDLYPGLSVQVTAAGSSTILAASDPSGTLTLDPAVYFPTNPFTLPVTGTYEVRVSGKSDKQGFGLYRLGVVSAP